MTTSMHRYLLVAMLALAGCATSPQPSSKSPTTIMPAAVETPAPVQSSETEPTPTPRDVATGAVPTDRKPLAVSEFVERNDERLLQIYVGMSRRSVEQLMQGVGTGPYANPFRRQLLTDLHGDRYEVLYFLTRAPATGRRVTENQLTPVIFRDDRVVAIGRFPLKKLRRGECPGRRSACP